MDRQLLAENVAKLRQRVRLAAQKSQRSISEMRLLPVSKTRPAEDIRQAHGCGFDEFGESYLQEALPKMAELESLNLVWHFIGPIQSNKTRQIARHFDWVHSVDRGKIARRLNEQRPPDMPPLQVCLQVNISGEPSKSGLSLEELPQLVNEFGGLEQLCLRGLMAIPAPSNDKQQQRAAFASVRLAMEEIKALAPGMDTLSMGMSGDLEAAIAEGSTILRVGTAFFGPRNR